MVLKSVSFTEYINIQGKLIEGNVIEWSNEVR